MLAWTGGELFLNSLDASVDQLFQARHYFDPLLTPVRPLVGVYGRAGCAKAEALIDYCVKRGLPQCLITVELGQTNKVKTAIDKQINTLRHVGAVKLESYHANLVVIIDKADRLVFNPDDTESMMYVMTLKQVALDNGLVIVCLFNKLPEEEQIASKDFGKAFFDQFSGCNLYFPSPNADHLKYMFEYLFKEFTTLVGALGRSDNITVTMNDGHFEQLADFAAYSTVDDVLTFCRKIFYDVLSPNPPQICRPLGKEKEKDSTSYPITVNMLVVESYTHKANDTPMPRLFNFDPKIVESKFSIKCGAGPVGVSMTAGALEAEKKRAEMLSEEQKKDAKRVREAWEEMGEVGLETATIKLAKTEPSDSTTKQ